MNAVYNWLFYYRDVFEIVKVKSLCVFQNVEVGNWTITKLIQIIYGLLQSFVYTDIFL